MSDSANTVSIDSGINVASAHDTTDCLVAKLIRCGKDCSYRESTRRLYL